MPRWKPWLWTLPRPGIARPVPLGARLPDGGPSATSAMRAVGNAHRDARRPNRWAARPSRTRGAHPSFPHLRHHGERPDGQRLRLGSLLRPRHKRAPQARLCAMDRLWTNARLATMGGGLASASWRTWRRWPRAGRADRLGRRGRRRPCRSRGGHRLRGPLDHARADRLPHPSGLSAATARHEFELRLAGASYRGDRAGRRRHRLDHDGDAGGERGGAGGQRACPGSMR